MPRYAITFDGTKFATKDADGDWVVLDSTGIVIGGYVEAPDVRSAAVKFNHALDIVLRLYAQQEEKT